MISHVSPASCFYMCKCNNNIVVLCCLPVLGGSQGKNEFSLLFLATRFMNHPHKMPRGQPRVLSGLIGQGSSVRNSSCYSRIWGRTPLDKSFPRNNCQLHDNKLAAAHLLQAHSNTCDSRSGSWLRCPRLVTAVSDQHRNQNRKDHRHKVHKWRDCRDNSVRVE